MTPASSECHSRCTSSATPDGPLTFRDERRTVVLVASGLSAGTADLDLARDWPVVVVNDAWRLAPWAAALYACDGPWWKVHHAEVVKTFRGELWTQDEKAARSFGLKWIRGKQGNGLSNDGDRINHNSNGGAQAMNLAYHWGARRFVLVGYDMGGRHFFGDHPPALRNNSPYHAFIKAFGVIAGDCKRLGLEVVNTSSISRLPYFPRTSLSSTLGASAA